MRRISSVDVGTGTIVAAEFKDNKLQYYKTKDAFFKIDPSNFIMSSSLEFGENMLKKAGANYVKIDNVLYILGDDAFKFATMFHKECLRPMSKGVLNPFEPESIIMVGELIRGVLGKATSEDDLVYYCIPADPIDADFDIIFHASTVKKVLENLGYKNIYKMNEGLCVIYSELEKEGFSGLGISAGAGMINISYAFLGMPIFSFSISKSGDWVDSQAAKATNETCSIVQYVKENNIDLNNPKNKIENAISIYYDSLIEYTVDQFRKLYVNTDPKKLPNIIEPLKLVVAGGTSMPKGFTDKLTNEINKGFPVPISKVIHASDPLYAVARGLYNAAKVKAESEEVKAEEKKN